MKNLSAKTGFLLETGKVQKDGMGFQERVPSKVYQLSLRVQDPAVLATARAVLAAAGFSGQMVETLVKGRSGLEIFDSRKNVEQLKGLFQRLRIKDLQACSKTLKPSNWLTRWKAGWKPAPLTKTLDVVPVWYQNKYRPKPGWDYILMDTLLSFGTGLHETTQIMAQFIEDQSGKFKSFLDIGTGTGILSLVALKCGAEKVLAVDIGQLSVEAARCNSKVNQLNFTVKKADINAFRHARTYDLVAANLVTQDLIDAGPKIVAFVKPGGRLAVSGISLDNLVQMRQAWAALPLQCLEICKGKQWSGLLFQKKT